jgi:hypothetical protein
VAGAPSGLGVTPSLKKLIGDVKPSGVVPVALFVLAGVPSLNMTYTFYKMNRPSNRTQLLTEMSTKGKDIPVNRPIGLRVVKAPTLLRQTANTCRWR